MFGAFEPGRGSQVAEELLFGQIQFFSKDPGLGFARFPGDLILIPGSAPSGWRVAAGG